MKYLHRYRVEILFVGYWLIHAINCVRVSHNTFYFPSELNKQATLAAQSQPYPLGEIALAWLILGVVTFIIYKQFLKNNIGNIYFILIAFFLLNTIILPTHVGGVNFAFSHYQAITLVIVVIYSLIKYISKGKVVEK